MKYTLSQTDLLKILKGASMALGGALITYLLQLLPNVDFGTYTPVVVALASIILNSLNKFFTDTTVVSS